MSLPKIAVIGAGPAGLTFARLVQYNGIPCTIFELDSDRNARSRGGSLDIHEGSAQIALREAGLYEKFLAVARPEGEVLKIYDPSGNLILDESKGVGESRPDSFKGRPEVDRVQLRSMLLDSLEPGSIKWGHKLQRVETSANATSLTYDLHFQNSVERGFDLVVGADGAWSKVRHTISNTRPQFAGITGVEAKILNIDQKDPALAKRVGLGMCLTLGNHQTVLSQRNGDGSVQTYGFFRRPEDWQETCGIDWSAPGVGQKFVDKYYEDWNQDAKDLIIKSDEEAIPRPMYMLPIGHKWLHRAGATLLGDAAHLMTPFAGVGVNVAMEDGMELARAVIARKPNWEGKEKFEDAAGLSEAVRKYELAMFDRAEGYAKETWMYLNLFFNERGGHAMVESFAEQKKQQKKEAESKPLGKETVNIEAVSI
ncbi:hypothetical protein EAE96_008964 [Botrytis aclada]|nr:hypothetical protein EAE96_008964 [Botrytis aclada]